MPLTKSFKKLVRNRTAEDPEFAAILSREGVETILANDEADIPDADARTVHDVTVTSRSD